MRLLRYWISRRPCRSDQAWAFALLVAGQSGDGGVALGASPHPDDGCVAAPGPGAGSGRRDREVGLAFEAEPGPERRHGVSTCGQVPFPRPMTASSSRSVARRAGTWWLKPCRCRICAIADSVMLLWSRRPIRVLIRAASRSGPASRALSALWPVPARALQTVPHSAWTPAPSTPGPMFRRAPMPDATSVPAAH
jgi:hypothetical protein